jgi:DNA-3-methyladenine glycosylase II
MSRRIRVHLSTADANMQALIQATGEYRLTLQPQCHPFESLARAIAHQQLHATAANSILRRLIEDCGGGQFPSPTRLLETSQSRLRAVGFSLAKIAALRDLAEKSLSGVVPERSALLHLSDEQIIERLTEVRGIGRWTVEMLLMFQLGRPDVFPVDDFGVRNGFRLAYGLRKLPATRAFAAYALRWAPHRTAAAWYLWRANDLHKAGRLPRPAEKVRLPRIGRRRRARPTAGTVEERAAALRARVRTVPKPRARK